jgi:hypothetical protein
MKAAMDDAALAMQIRQTHQQLVNDSTDGKGRQDWF